MSIFGRLFGSKPPALPPGAQVFVDGYGALRDHFCVMVQAGALKEFGPYRVGPVFSTLSGAQMYRSWVERTGKLNWDVNGVGLPV